MAKNLSKKTRFEVFKRDSFRCQYCGQSAPDVLLQVDHIEPKSKGGSNDIINLITACAGCNAGKSDRKLSDQSTLAKQRDQLQELNERREQLELMVKWKQGLLSVADTSVEKLSEYWTSMTPGWFLNESGQQELKKLLKQFTVEEVLDAMTESVETYIKNDGDKATKESVETAWKKVGAICVVRRRSKDEPYLKDLYYVRGILRNRGYVNEKVVMDQLKEAVANGVKTEELKELAKKCRSWTAFWEEVRKLTNQG